MRDLSFVIDQTRWGARIASEAAPCSWKDWKPQQALWNLGIADFDSWDMGSHPCLRFWVRGPSVCGIRSLRLPSLTISRHPAFSTVVSRWLPVYPILYVPFNNSLPTTWVFWGFLVYEYRMLTRWCYRETLSSLRVPAMLVVCSTGSVPRRQQFSNHPTALRRRQLHGNVCLDRLW